LLPSKTDIKKFRGSQLVPKKRQHSSQTSRSIPRPVAWLARFDGFLKDLIFANHCVALIVSGQGFNYEAPKSASLRN
jgi:hypothetical protein